MHAPALLWFSASSAADVGITVGLVWTNLVWDLPLSKLYSNDTHRARGPPASHSRRSGSHSAPRQGTHTEIRGAACVRGHGARDEGWAETPSLTTKFEEFDDLGGDEQVRELDVLELGGVRGEAESQITETARSSGTGTGTGTMRRTDSETGQAYMAFFYIEGL
ncbi:hypothetical protein K438DRAFT_1982077 [Mycena galopus ATCC 62051]|nr:hypothetical protein K438DRAFT_1982077 [Mycena galopus ATCC 62051]